MSLKDFYKKKLDILLKKALKKNNKISTIDIDFLCEDDDDDKMYNRLLEELKKQSIEIEEIEEDEEKDEPSLKDLAEEEQIDVSNEKEIDELIEIIKESYTKR